MTKLIEPNKHVYSKAKVKIALMSFLLSQNLCVPKSDIEGEMRWIKGYLKDCVRANNFEQELSNVSDVEIDKCIDELLELILQTLQREGLKSIFKIREDLWLMHYLDPDLIVDVLSHKSLISDCNLTNLDLGSQDSKSTLQFRGGCSVTIDVNQEQFIITIKNGQLDRQSIETDNGYAIGEVDESYDKLQGSIQYCATIAMCWLSYQLFWIEARKQGADERRICYDTIVTQGSC